MEENTFDMYDSWKPGFWWIRSRRDVLEKSIRKLNLCNNPFILDVGAGSGLFHETLKKFGQVINLEYSDNGISHLKKKKIDNLLQGDAQTLPLKSNSVDVVTCIDVMEHVANDKILVDEVHKVLKPGGFFVITVPAYMFLWSDDDVLVHHKRRYTTKTLKKLINRKFILKKSTYRFFFLFLPTLCLFQIKKVKRIILGKKYILKNSLEKEPSTILNFVFCLIMKLENWLIDSGISFPFGVNILVVLKKI